MADDDDGDDVITGLMTRDRRARIRVKTAAVIITPACIPAG